MIGPDAAAARRRGPCPAACRRSRIAAPRGLRAITAALLVAAAAYALPARAESPYEATVQYALEHFESGRTISAATAGTRFTIEPLRTWKSVSGHWCRRFELIATLPDGAVDHQQRTRCRDQDGIWKQAQAH